MWYRLNRVLAKSNPGYDKILMRVRGKLDIQIEREKAIESRLAEHPELLRKICGPARLWSENGRVGRQLFCSDQGCYLDLLMTNPKTGQLWVIELGQR